MNFLKKFLGSAPTDEVALIPSGRLFLARSPQSPKGELECLYNDAFASIRQTTTPFYYQLCITRVYQEGELDAHGSSGFDDSDDSDEDDHDTPHSISDSNAGGHSKDEWNFSILEELKIHTYDKADGSKTLAWKDLNGDLGDRFEFTVDSDIKLTEFDSFMFALYKCLFELKYHKSSLSITNMSQLQEFIYNPKSELLTFDDLRGDFLNYEDDEASEDIDTGDDYQSVSSTDEFHDAESRTTPSATIKKSSGKDERSPVKSNAAGIPSIFSSEKAALNTGNVLYECSNFDLHLFDSDAGVFNLQVKKPELNVKIVELENWTYSLRLLSSNKSKPINFECILSADMNPTFNFEYLSFIFNHFIQKSETQTLAYSWLLKFSHFNELQEFQVSFMKAMWESLNKIKWNKSRPSEQNYVLDAFSKLAIDDEDLTEDDKKEINEMSDDDMLIDNDYSDDEDAINKLVNKSIRGETTKPRHKYVDDDDDEYGDYDEEKQLDAFKRQQDKNSNLSVGYANDRSYVVRGDKLGVFNNSNNNLNYQTTISNLKTLDGKRFTPEQVMLHMQDQYMVMSNKDMDDKRLYKMDLNRGKIVDEWEVDDIIPIESYGPNSKFSQLTNEQTLTGMSRNKLFKVDPRLPTTKLVQGDDNLRTPNYNFLALSTTEQGFLAVGSAKGDIRLFDRLGTNAKSLLPSLGEAIIGIDVSNDGRWILATCKTYLLLVDAKVGASQRNEGSLGYVKSFDKDKKPKPRRLTIKPEHVAYMSMKTEGKPLQFTKAYFNTGIDSKETTIVTSTGPYIISWSLKKVLSNNSSKEDQPYLIKRYDQNVIADNFKFGSNSDVIIALQDDVSMANKKNFRKANKSSLFSRDNVVNNY